MDSSQAKDIQSFRSLMMRSLLFLSCCVVGSALLDGVAGLPALSEAISQAEAVLRKDCGEECVQLLRSLTAASELNNATDNKAPNFAKKYP